MIDTSLPAAHAAAQTIRSAERQAREIATTSGPLTPKCRGLSAQDVARIAAATTLPPGRTVKSLILKQGNRT